MPPPPRRAPATSRAASSPSCAGEGTDALAARQGPPPAAALAAAQRPADRLSDRDRGPDRLRALGWLGAPAGRLPERGPDRHAVRARRRELRPGRGAQRALRADRVRARRDP